MISPDVRCHEYMKAPETTQGKVSRMDLEERMEMDSISKW